MVVVSLVVGTSVEVKAKAAYVGEQSNYWYIYMALHNPLIVFQALLLDETRHAVEIEWRLSSIMRQQPFDWISITRFFRRKTMKERRNFRS